MKKYRITNPEHLCPFTVPGKGEMYCNAAYSDECKTCKQKKRYETEFEATYDAWENSWIDGAFTVPAEEEEEEFYCGFFEGNLCIGCDRECPLHPEFEG